MVANAHHIAITKTARYFTLGEVNAQTKHLWLVCHGYGHLAEFFIRKFDALQDEQSVVIAPEGLHRFYLNGTEGRVGASWMTKEDRLNDIKDYVVFLNTLCKQLLISPDIKLHIIGFSQGVATISRWISMGNYQADSVTLWAGVFPPDMDFNINKERLLKSRNYMVVGDADEYLSAAQVQQHLDDLQEKEIPCKFLSFQGTHEINREVLLQLKQASIACFSK